MFNVACYHHKGNYRRKLLCLHRVEIGGKLVVFNVFNARSVCGCGVSSHSFLQQPRTAIKLRVAPVYQVRNSYNLSMTVRQRAEEATHGAVSKQSSFVCRTQSLRQQCNQLWLAQAGSWRWLHVI
jgi:hypothetical protein